MKYMKRCIFCNRKLTVSRVGGSGGHFFRICCSAHESNHEFVISQRGDSHLNRISSEKEVVIEGIKSFKKLYPTKVPLVFLDEIWKVTIVKLPSNITGF